MRHLSLMLKPSSGMCNMRCKYCFYADETQKRSVPSYGFMSLETLEQVMKKALDAADGSCTICFQGGEPTLAGLDFFRHAVELGAPCPPWLARILEITRDAVDTAGEFTGSGEEKHEDH